MNQDNDLKITVIGDGFVGKTSLLVAYTSGEFPQEYVPTVFENHVKTIHVDGKDYVATLWDTAGQEDYERIRPLAYPNTTCFVLCYSTIDKTSFENILRKWIPEVRKYQPNTPIILSGTKMDARKTMRDKSNIVTIKEGKKMRKKLKNCSFMECSAKERIGLNEIFAEAVRLSVQKSVSKDRKFLLPFLKFFQ